jgi:16S rRNA (guanine527-N7)-methyltransferase
MDRNRQPVSRHPAPSLVCRTQLERRWEALGMPQRGLDLTAAQFDALAGYVALLLQWQRHLNLTGLRDIEQLIDVLVLESLDFLQGEFLSGSRRVLDLGTGAGVPGIPLAICQPQLAMTLLDRSQKKMIFVRRVIARLQLRHCRTQIDGAEALSRRLLLASEPMPAGLFDAVVSRGVGTVAHLLSLAEPLLRPGGVLLLRKPLQTPELEAAAPVLASGAWAAVQTVPLHGHAPGTQPWALLAIVKQTPTGLPQVR